MTLSPGAKVQPKCSPFRSLAGIERGLKSDVQQPRPDGTPVHGAKHLHVADRVQAETSGDARLHQLGDACCSGLGVVHRHEVEVAYFLEFTEFGHLALVDAMGVDDDPALRCLAEHLGEAHHRHRPGGDDIGKNLAGPDSWSTSPKISRDAPYGTALRRACISRRSTIEVSSTTSSPQSSRWSASRRNPPVLGSTSSRRWIVRASIPVASLMRLRRGPSAHTGGGA